MTFLKQCVAEYYQRPAEEFSFLKTHNGAGSYIKKVIFFVFGSGDTSPRSVVYASRDVGGNQTLSASIARCSAQGAIAPKLLHQAAYEGVECYVMEYINGQGLSYENPNQLAHVSRWISDRTTARLVNEKKTFADFYSDIVGMYTAIGITMPPALDRLCKDACADFKSVLLPAVPQHGDFQAAHIFFQDEKMRIIDWDNFGMTTAPWYDFMTFFLRSGSVGKAHLEKAWQDFSAKISLPKDATILCTILTELLDCYRKMIAFDRPRQEVLVRLEADIIKRYA